MKRNTIVVGDIRDHLQHFPDASVDCIVTSPPYFALRNYGHPNQIGLEATVEDWVQELRLATRSLARVLRPTGTFWLNVGDSYSAHTTEGAVKKSLLLGPQKLAIALADDGWLIRNQIIWAKPNGLPSSVTDRLSNSYEVVLLLTRSPRYFFDLDAIRVPGSHPNKRRITRRHVDRPPGYPPQSVTPLGGGVDLNHGLDAMKRRGISTHPLGKSPGDVWSIPTAGYRGAHFATFPIALAERAVLAGCPERVCATCQTPWLRARARQNQRLLRTGTLQPHCACAGDWVPGLVLDPFMGAGTTAIAAASHRRDWLGIELNPEYAAQALERISKEHNTTT